MPYKDSAKQKEAMRKIRRDYKKRKKAEAEQAQRVLMEHVKVQSKQTFIRMMTEGAYASESVVFAKLDFKPNEVKLPSFLESVVDEIVNETSQFIPPSKKFVRDWAKTAVYQRYEWIKDRPEDMEYTTYFDRHMIDLYRLNAYNKEEEKAKEQASVYTLNQPKREELYIHGKIKHFKECLCELERLGIHPYAAREACGQRFFSLSEFWSKEWHKVTAENMARSRYDLGAEFWEIDDPNVEWVKKWKERNLEKLREIIDLKVEDMKYSLETLKNHKIFDNLVRLSIEEGYDDNGILERVKHTALPKVVDPTYIKMQIPKLRREHEIQLRYKLEQMILKGIIEGLEDDQIKTNILEHFNTYEDELKEHIQIIRKGLHEELTEWEQKALTKITPIKKRLIIKV